MGIKAVSRKFLSQIGSLIDLQWLEMTSTKLEGQQFTDYHRSQGQILERIAAFVFVTDLTLSQK